MSCGEATDAFESSYLTLLGQSRFYNVRANTLTIRGADLAILLVFDAAPANPLLGSWVVDSYAPTPSSLTAPLPGTELTAVFRLQQGRRLVRLQHVPGSVHDERDGRGDRSARVDTDGLRR